MDKGNLHGTAKLSFDVRATLSAEQQHTGRRIRADSLRARIQAWATSAVFERSDAEVEFVNALSKSPRLAASQLICFRGQRRFPSEYTPQSEEMGPPLSDKASPGRYNAHGSPVLYLCETEQGIMREPISGAGPLWIQRFTLPTDTLEIADLRPSQTTEFVNQVLWFAEHAGEAPNHCAVEFSQRVASLVATKFDGMMVPGIRGDESHRYTNIVVLKRVSAHEAAGGSRRCIDGLGVSWPDHRVTGDIQDKLLAQRRQPPNKVQSGFYESGYAASCVLLLVAMFESYVSRVRFVQGAKVTLLKRSAIDVVLAVYPRLRRRKALKDVYVLRDLLIHNAL